MLAYIDVPFGSTKEEAEAEQKRLLPFVKAKLKANGIEVMEYEGPYSDKFGTLGLHIAKAGKADVAVFRKDFSSDRVSMLVFISCAILKKKTITE